MRKTFLLLATLALCLTALTVSGPRSSASPAPPKAKGQKLHKKEKAIPGKYIVVLDNDAAGHVGIASQADQLTEGPPPRQRPCRTLTPPFFVSRVPPS